MPEQIETAEELAEDIAGRFVPSMEHTVFVSMVETMLAKAMRQVRRQALVEAVQFLLDMAEAECVFSSMAAIRDAAEDMEQALIAKLDAEDRPVATEEVEGAG